MQIFYAPGITGSRYVLDEKESRHCVKVIRLKKGSPVRLIDGKGNLYEGIISDPDPSACVIAVEKVITGFEKRPYRLHIAMSLLKNPERFEWFVEKSVEIGIDEITPLLCERTEKKGIRSERLKGIIVSAMKQSLKASLTHLNEPETFSSMVSKKYEGIRLIAHCDLSAARTSIREQYTRGSNALVLIGPEGDFTGGEIEEALSAGFRPVHLGESRLRTETAGIAACHSIYFING